MAKPPPRLYMPDAMGEGVNLPMEGPRWHYLHTVLRLKEGSDVLVFNGQDGEWQAHISAAERRRGVVSLTEQRRLQSVGPDLTLLFAPLKKDPLEFVIQKGTELGVRCFQPVVTARTILPKGGLKEERLEAIATEAAEQCERVDLPVLNDPLFFQEALNALPDDTQILFCDEAGDDPSARWGGEIGRGQSAISALSDAPLDTPWAIFIGPEGGFSPEERDQLRARDDTYAITLGPRILKAETAACAAITLWQAVRGDWR